MNNNTEFTRFALKSGALGLYPEGIELRSGRVSPYFFNAGRFVSGRNLNRLANAYAEIVYALDPRPEVIFGPAYKGIALAATVVSQLYVEYGLDVQYAYSRKEAKDHAEGGLLVGANLSGKRVVIIDDVVTEGETLDDAVRLVLESGGIPTACVIAFDRCECGEDSSQSAVQTFEGLYGIPVHSIVTVHTLMVELHERGDDYPGGMRSLLLIQEYFEKYGVW